MTGRATPDRMDVIPTPYERWVHVTARRGQQDVFIEMSPFTAIPLRPSEAVALAELLLDAVEEATRS